MINQLDTILITGADGFIGKHLYNFLQLKGYERIYRLVRNSHENIEALDSKKIIVGDICNKIEVDEVIYQVQPNVVFHLAANIEPTRNLKDLDEMLRTNIGGTMNLLTSIKLHNIPLNCFVNLGTCEEYGGNEQPYHESLIPSPVSLYSGTKAATTMLCNMMVNLFNIPIVTVRPSLVYGPGQKERFFITQAIKKLIANEDLDMTYGQQTRDFIYIDDFVAGLYTICKLKNVTGEVFNISSGVETSLLSVVEILKRLTASNSSINFGAIPYRESEIMSFNCDNSKLIKQSDWEPKISLVEGLSRVVNNYKSNIKHEKIS
ncbi:NAD(P)-dependent oxidoreductase [Paenibacillus dendritiformis]|uniref:NAD-dependent epimerase/dehydratase family protein n=1 Tax=Paenibacillus dendritiformis TaxID=130049 RepID=UPI00105A0678|nr:NAD(P)-dependent oxidoreductase [Paenibacillus dendritiformis]TDL51869.1 NAD(P)-dependent oxidoreductase [Paenibacillus dendritiformis]